LKGSNGTCKLKIENWKLKIEDCKL
jgi:hypothetical protein